MIAVGPSRHRGGRDANPVGPRPNGRWAYQLQAAMAAVHAEAAHADATDWRQILGLYDLLQRLAPGPMVTLNRVVAVSMVHGPRVALEQLATAEHDAALASHHRVERWRAPTRTGR